MNQTALVPAALLAIVAVLAGCAAPSDGPRVVERSDVSAALPEIVQKAVKVAKAIEDDPANVEAILESNGLDADRFEELMYEISSDPKLTEAYTAAMR